VVAAAGVLFGHGGRREHERHQQRKRQPHDQSPAHAAGCYRGGGARRPTYHHMAMAVLTASDLHKDIAGRALLRGVSFKLERRERLTLAGRNGAGKTTLLRMLAGASSIDRGELSIAKGARVALHDQRPPRERGCPLRDY